MRTIKTTNHFKIYTQYKNELSIPISDPQKFTVLYKHS